MPETPAEPEIECSYRSHVRQTESGEIAVCGLAAEISGISDPELLTFQRGACVACGMCFPPTRVHLNPVVASVVHIVGERVLERGGVPECTVEQARAFMRWSTAFLHRVSVGSRVDSLPLIPYQGHCFYLGDRIGEKPCVECRGSVRQKTFACHHENHAETAILECQQCEDYEPGLKKGSVRNWVVGVTAAPRSRPTLEESLVSLARAGWPEPFVFAEPHTDLPKALDPRRLVQRVARMGAWPNWFLGLQELVLRFPRADAYLMCQDDVLYTAGLRSYLEHSLWPDSRGGVVSLHTASHQDRNRDGGFYRADLGWDAWGAQAYVFSNPSARALLRHPLPNNHRHRGPRGGLYNVDSVVGAWSRRSGLPYYLHHPSLTQHVGEASAIWESGGTLGRRSAGSFPGEDFDVGTLMKSGERVAPEVRTDLAGAPDSPASQAEWKSKSLLIATPLIGRRFPFARWKSWLDRCQAPFRTSLVLVENSGDPEFATSLREAASELRAREEFDQVDLVPGPGPATGTQRLSMDKHENVTQAFNRALKNIDSDYVLTVDCDTIPETDALPKLITAMETLRARGEKPGAISGCYESATHRGHLVASRAMEGWGEIPRVGEVGPDELVPVGFAGTGCLLIDGKLLCRILPLRSAKGELRGPDTFLCSEVRRLGHSVWLHGGVCCDHVIG